MRIGTAEIYNVVENMPEVEDSIVVGQDWEDDVRVLLFVKLSQGVELTEELVNNIRAAIRTNTTPRHVPAKILAVTDIPYTINGKKVELAVKKVIHDQEVKNLDALGNPESLELYRDLVELKLVSDIGYLFHRFDGGGYLLFCVERTHGQSDGSAYFIGSQSLVQ